jgi:hypothetical protein
VRAAEDGDPASRDAYDLRDQIARSGIRAIVDRGRCHLDDEPACVFPDGTRAGGAGSDANVHENRAAVA